MIIIKYIGSKSRISKHVTNILNTIIQNNDIKVYIEPFVGGANIVDKVKCNTKICGDNNEYLIELWKSLQKGYEPIGFISREDYYDIKFNMDKYPKEVVALCGILASYNGNWFRAYGGYSATKTGKDRNYYAEGVRGLMKQVPKIKDVKFICCDYKEFSNYTNTLIYCDKPYENTDKCYSDKQFNHVAFWEWVREMSKNNTVIVSEFNAPKDFNCIWEKEMSITHANQKNKSTEKLFIHNSLIDKVKYIKNKRKR